MDGKKFATSQEEISYWRDAAQKFKHDLEETREELEEFQISSRELEAELETQIEQLEKKNSNLTHDNNKLQHEVDSLRSKLESLQGQSLTQISELESELLQVRAFKDELQKYIRELEQANDDLERAKRATVVSLEDFEARLNQAIERNAFLESELDEKETLSETVQRLKDEARDLRQELGVKTRPTPDSQTNSAATTPTNTNNNNNLITSAVVKHESSTDANHIDSAGGNVTPNKGIPTMNGGTPLTPSARISALNIVGDLLRKVGALETKLASCRNFVKDPPRGSNPRGGNSPVNSPRIVADTLIYGTPLANRVDPDETAPTGAVSSGSTLFAKTSNHVTMRTKRMTRAAVVHPQQNVKIPV